MVDRPETILKGKNGILHRYEMGEVEVSQNDTITLGNFDSSQTLLTAFVWKKTDGSTVTCSKSTNIITITGSGTNLDCLYVAYGYKA